MGPQSPGARFALLSVLRLLSACAVAGGMIIAFAEQDFVDPALRLPIGITTIVAGFVTLLGIVPSLTRRWATPK